MPLISTAFLQVPAAPASVRGHLGPSLSKSMPPETVRGVFEGAVDFDRIFTGAARVRLSVTLDI